MARIRTIKPGFFRSEDVSALPMRARLTWIGLWTQCDDQGRTKDNPKLIKADVWPLDPVTLTEIEEDLITLADHGRIVRYEVDGRRYLEITNWSDHQSINRPTPSKIPAPLSTENGSYPQVSTHTQLTEDSPQEGKGKERKGREGAREPDDGTHPESARTPEPPPRSCTKHPNGTTDRCGPCRDARLAHDQWQRDRTIAKATASRGGWHCTRCRTRNSNNTTVCHQCDTPRSQPRDQ
jgi:hypothetical protein